MDKDPLELTYRFVCKFDSENVFLALLLSFTVLLLWDSRSYEYESSVFPQVILVFMLVSILLLMGRSYLPSAVRAVLLKDVSIASGTVDELDVEDDEDTKEPINGLKASILIVGFVAVGYLVGLLYAAPVFAYAYSVWFGRSQRIAIGQAIVVFAIGMVFVEFFNARIVEGVLTEGMFR